MNAPQDFRRPGPASPTAAEPASRSAADCLIVALDFSSQADALSLVDRLGGACKWFKVGLELYLAAGNSIISALKQRGFSVFLDLKLHDIPNTVAGAVAAVAGLKADLLTVHALGGPAMLAAAQRAAESIPDAPRLLAVTVLTSMDEAQLGAIGIDARPGTEALLLARMARDAGISGIVCSPHELGPMRASLPDALIVTPGIRPSGTDAGDQRRIATPAIAIADGADYLVVGRPITQAADPLRATTGILAEIESALNHARLTAPQTPRQTDR